MKKLFFAVAIALSCATGMAETNRAMKIVAEINNPKSDKVLVASHRGDWRNYPENSLGGHEFGHQHGGRHH